MNVSNTELNIDNRNFGPKDFILVPHDYLHLHIFFFFFQTPDVKDSVRLSSTPLLKTTSLFYLLRSFLFLSFNDSITGTYTFSLYFTVHLSK